MVNLLPPGNHMPRGIALACEVAIYKFSMHLVGLKRVIQETPLGAPYTLTFPDQALNRFTLNPQGSGIRQEMGLLSVILGPLLIKESLPRPNKGVEVHNCTRVGIMQGFPGGASAEEPACH